MKPEYRIVKSIGHNWQQRYELQRKYNYFAKYEDMEPVIGWSMEVCGTKEFCEECLQHRLDRINKGLEPTLYEQRRKEDKEKGIDLLPIMA